MRNKGNGIYILLILALVVLNVFLGRGGTGAEQSQSGEDIHVLTTEERLQIRQELELLTVDSGIQPDGMSVTRGSAGQVELGVSEVDVYCKDKYRFVPLRGDSLTWKSSDETIATVDENGRVKTLKAGSAVITATDPAGNSDQCTVNVIKVVYVTIDDTPTKYTPKLLDILDEYGVKATFFMNADPKEADQYVEIYKRGHTFALHGYKHNTAYKDGEAFLKNMEDCRDFIIETTGCDDVEKLFRFPTGSKGSKIYKEILGYMQERGYRAYDWTTEFHDYYYHTASNCLEYFKTYLTHDRDVFLFHPREWSIEALPDALDYIKAQGYTTAIITEDTAEHNFRGIYPED
ncbi:MAG: hypothetical protein E7554_01550 [Ruminococcaceae bacterium]|nr:hypothetical protein [Oscillospiraceae bacterium]